MKTPRGIRRTASISLDTAVWASIEREAERTGLSKSRVIEQAADAVLNEDVDWTRQKDNLEKVVRAVVFTVFNGACAHAAAQVAKAERKRKPLKRLKLKVN